MRVAFAGTPTVALPSLQALLASRHEVVGVLTRADARAGRGRALRPSPVKELALEHGLPVLTPGRLTGDGEDARLVRETLADWRPDAVAVVAYGMLLPADLLDAVPHGWINLHFSLLPAWRGAAPVQHTIRAGDEVTGAVTFRIDEGLDTGPVLGRMTEAVRPDDTSGVLLDRLAEAGSHLLVATLDGIEDGRVVPEPQGTAGVSHAPRIQPADARISWTDPAFAIDRLVRSCTPAPGAWTTWRGDRFKVGPVRDVEPDAGVGLAPGEIHVERNRVLVGTGTGPLLLQEVQPHGKKRMAADAWARGVRPEAGERFDG